MASPHHATATAVDLERLTNRERQTLELLAVGYTTADIARQLHIRYGTVRIYVHRILRAFQVEDRLQAVVAYLYQTHTGPDTDGPTDPERLARAENALALAKSALADSDENQPRPHLTHTLRDALYRYERDFGPLDS